MHLATKLEIVRQSIIDKYGRRGHEGIIRELGRLRKIAQVSPAAARREMRKVIKEGKRAQTVTE